MTAGHANPDLGAIRTSPWMVRCQIVGCALHRRPIGPMSKPQALRAGRLHVTQYGHPATLYATVIQVIHPKPAADDLTPAGRLPW